MWLWTLFYLSLPCLLCFLSRIKIPFIHGPKIHTFHRQNIYFLLSRLLIQKHYYCLNFSIVTSQTKLSQPTKQHIVIVWKIFYCTYNYRKRHKVGNQPNLHSSLIADFQKQMVLYCICQPSQTFNVISSNPHTIV